MARTGRWALTALALALFSGAPSTALADEPPVGYLDSVSALGGSGWAYDPDAGTAPIDVHVYVDGALFRIVTANARRDDLVTAGVAPNPEHGFGFDLAGLAAGQHTIVVYAINAGTDPVNPVLAGSPVSLTVTNGIAGGVFEAASASGGSGWAADPDSGNGAHDPIEVHVYVDGAYHEAVLANESRPDLVAEGAAPNPEHGFHFSLAGLAPGPHRVDVYAIDATGGVNPLLQNSPRFVTGPEPDQPPVGVLDALNVDGGSGWAYDPDAGTLPLDVHIYVDGALFRIVKANARRDDLVSGGVAPNAEHGFGFDLSGLAPGTHTVVAYAINVGTNSNNPAPTGSPRQLVVGNAVPSGVFDSASATGGSGWAVDLDAGNGGQDPIEVHVYVDDVYHTAVLANDTRPDLVTGGAAPNPEHGFHFTLSGLQPGMHRIDVYAIDATGGVNPLIRDAPRFVSVGAVTEDKGWDPGLQHRRIANYLPWEPDTYFESCPDDPNGCYPDLATGFYTLSTGIGDASPNPNQPCTTNSGESFLAGPSGMQPCPFEVNWGEWEELPQALLRANTKDWSTTLTPAIYMGFHENQPYGTPGPGPTGTPYFGGENPANIENFLFSAKLQARYEMPVLSGQSPQLRFLAGTTWYVPESDMSVVLELNLDAVTHADPATDIWTTQNRVQKNVFCPPEWLCLYLGSRAWGVPGVLGDQPTEIFVNWSEIARSLQDSGDIAFTDKTTGLPVDVLGARPVVAYVGIEQLGAVDAELKVSGFRQMQKVITPD